MQETNSWNPNLVPSTSSCRREWLTLSKSKRQSSPSFKPRKPSHLAHNHWKSSWRVWRSSRTNYSCSFRLSSPLLWILTSRSKPSIKSSSESTMNLHNYTNPSQHCNPNPIPSTINNFTSLYPTKWKPSVTSSRSTRQYSRTKLYVISNYLRSLVP